MPASLARDLAIFPPPSAPACTAPAQAAGPGILRAMRIFEGRHLTEVDVG